MKSQKKFLKKKRVLVSPDQKSKHQSTPIEQLINFGPVTAHEFITMGIKTYSQLEKLGWEEACRMWVDHYPQRLNTMAFMGILATLEGIPWTKATEQEKAPARRLVQQLRSEFNLPLLKSNLKKSRKK